MKHGVDSWLVADGSLTVSPGLFLYGNDVTERNQTAPEGHKKVWIESSRLLVSGVLSRFFLYAKSDPQRRFTTSRSRIQIWRPVTEPGRPKYTLVWQRRVLLNVTNYGLLYTVIFQCIVLQFSCYYSTGLFFRCVYLFVSLISQTQHQLFISFTQKMWTSSQ